MSRTESLDDLLNSVIKKSRVSLAFTAIFVVFVLVAITSLSKKAIDLSDEVENQKQEIMRNKVELSRRQKELNLVRSQISAHKESVGYLQSAIRHLLNRNYPDAIAGFEKFLKISPGDAEGLNYLGYTEYRYATQLADSASDSVSLGEINSIYASSENHLRLSIEKDPDNIWPRYNLTLLLYRIGKVDEADSSLQNLLADHADAAGFICDDGQFRKYVKDRKSSSKIGSIISSEISKRGIDKCWVIS